MAVGWLTGGPVFALVKGHDRVSGTHKPEPFPYRMGSGSNDEINGTSLTF